MSKHSNLKSFCYEPLMYFVNEHHKEDTDYYPANVLDYFFNKCISRPIDALYYEVESPTFAHEIQKMIVTYDWYITNRFYAFQFIYPVVSFLRLYYSIILHSSDVDLYKKMLRAYLESIKEETI